MRYALVPVKDLTQAKERLSGLLSPPERRRLAAAMLDDVLAALERATEVERIALVTSDKHVLSMADQRGFEAIDEGRPRGLTEAVKFGIEVCQQRGAASLAVVPSDIPLMTSEDVDRIMAYGTDYEVVIVPSWNSRGTNTILLSPPDVLALRFGSWSFFPHVKQAKRAGLRYIVVRVPHVALDVDTPEDLRKVAVEAKGTRSYTVLKEIGMVERTSPLQGPAG
jgi:2-phospho-L-lactate guanylyltransferase